MSIPSGVEIVTVTLNKGTFEAMLKGTWNQPLQDFDYDLLSERVQGEEYSWDPEWSKLNAEVKEYYKIMKALRKREYELRNGVTSLQAIKPF